MNIQLYLFIIVLLLNYGFAQQRLGPDDSVEGKPIRICKHPYFAQLAIKEHVSDGRLRFTRCGATLIHPQWILTAAHCFFGTVVPTYKVPPGDQVRVYMGTDKQIEHTTEAVTRFIQKAIIHPNYVFRSPYAGAVLEYFERNDVAVALLNAPFMLNSHIQTVMLPHNNTKLCKAGIILGTPIIPSSPRIWEYSNLRPKTVEKINLVPEFITSDTVFYTEVRWYMGIYPIYGYAGGPFICFYKLQSVQYGIISSFYNSSIDGTLITVYESTEAHIDFIKKYVPIEF